MIGDICGSGRRKRADDAEKLAALRRLAKVGIVQLDRGRGLEFTSIASLAKHVESLGSTPRKPLMLTPARGG